MSDYPPNMTFRPLDGWPRDFTRGRRNSPFRATFNSTLGDLRQELHALGNGGPRSWYQRDAYPVTVLQLALRDRDIRVDGMPRADAKVAHPGIILNIESKHGDLSYPCDTFDDWRDNVRAVTLGLEALRKLDRYGITQTGQQYRGWLAIEAAPSSSVIGAARSVLVGIAYPDDSPERRGAWVDQMTTSNVVAATVLRKAKGNAHPDRHGGDRTMWEQVEQAAKVLNLREARAV
ncbi:MULTISPECIES: molecular chaperone DnaJ [unclassified Mycobacterium]|uniref:molecular chaperone DnaJ n=1 Tax=unclassified Mycobacterium TaxID=2642494 RepID=UPI0029C753ED|nr:MULTISPECIES: molecular chaperone DnaJ [unclassified Mycobacterium]